MKFAYIYIYICVCVCVCVCVFIYIIILHTSLYMSAPVSYYVKVIRRHSIRLLVHVMFVCTLSGVNCLCPQLKRNVNKWLATSDTHQPILFSY